MRSSDGSVARYTYQSASQFTKLTEILSGSTLTTEYGYDNDKRTTTAKYQTNYIQTTNYAFQHDALFYGVAMKYDYKIVNIYIDKNGTLYIVPTGESKKFGGAIVDLDLIAQLDFPYLDNDLEDSLMKALEDCFSIEPNVSLSVSALERYLNIKGFSKAVKDKCLVILGWNCDEGYYFLPTKKLTKQGFEHLEIEKIYIGKKLKKGVLSIKFKDAVKLSQ